MNTTLAERLKLARKEKGLSQKALGELIGVSQAAIQKIEVGKAKETTKILDLANALEVRPEWLSSGSGEMRGASPNLHRESNIPPEREWGTVDAWDSGTPLPDDEVEVPFLKDIELACGDGSFGDEDYNGFMLRFSKATLKRVGAQKGSVLCFPAHGNSMEPLIPEGATVAINLLDKKIVDGKVYAINQDGWKRLKALHRSGPNKIIIRSFNSAEYDDEEAEIDQIEILGRMFWTSMIW
ncbi:S24 family peptidase [Serratia marcescens]|uniref:S24 family peptidase n=1 Tax=Serratia marcescens TaxID=615 RepID=UPI001F14EDB1|nr:helix-turn-helix transcriptional regulator [Serratia marcescens]